MGGERSLKCIKCRPRPHHRWRWELKTTVLHTSAVFIFHCLWPSILSLSRCLFSEPEFSVVRYTTFSSNSQTSFHPLLLKPTFTGWPWNVSPKTYIGNLATNWWNILEKRINMLDFCWSLVVGHHESWRKIFFHQKKNTILAQLFWATGATDPGPVCGATSTVCGCARHALAPATPASGSSRPAWPWPQGSWDRIQAGQVHRG